LIDNADVVWYAYTFHADAIQSGEYKDAHGTFDVACIRYVLADGTPHILPKDEHYSFSNDSCNDSFHPTANRRAFAACQNISRALNKIPTLT